MLSYADFDVEQADGLLCVSMLCERVADREAEVLLGEIEPLLDRTDGLIVDIARVNVLTSAGIGMLVRLHKKLRTQNGRLIVCGLNRELDELFTITCMDRLLHIEPDRAAAERGLKG